VSKTSDEMQTIIPLAAGYLFLNHLAFSTGQQCSRQAQKKNGDDCEVIAILHHSLAAACKSAFTNSSLT
jgi:hypothetical protein